MCWEMMISAICNKNELRIQEMSRVSCESVWVATTDVWVQAKKYTYQDTSRTQKPAQIEVIALSMCWGVMISAICNKNELKIQEISWLLCVGCGIYANEVKIHTFRGWINSAKTGALFYSAQKVSSEGQRNLAIKTKPRPILFAYWAELSVAGPKRNYQRDIHCSSFFFGTHLAIFNRGIYF